MNKVITTIVVIVWLLGTLGLFAAKLFGAGYGWWTATIGLWEPIFMLLTPICLVAVLFNLLTFVRILSGSLNPNDIISNGKE